jgi:hypothetical protein
MKMTLAEAEKQYEMKLGELEAAKKNNQVPQAEDALLNRMLWLRAMDRHAEPAQTAALYNEVLGLIRTDRQSKVNEDVRAALNRQLLRAAANDALGGRKMPAGIKRFILNLGTDLESALKTLFGSVKHDVLGANGELESADINFARLLSMVQESAYCVVTIQKRFVLLPSISGAQKTFNIHGRPMSAVQKVYFAMGTSIFTNMTEAIKLTTAQGRPSI